MGGTRSQQCEGAHYIRSKGGEFRKKAVRRGTMNNDPLDQVIDFSKGVRGKFYRPGMEVRIPVYLEQGLLESLTEVASRKGLQLDALVNDLLRKALAIAEALR